MKRAAQIVSWVLLAFILIATFGLYGVNPNTAGPEDIIPLLPLASALAVYHFAAARWFRWAAFVLNCFSAFIGLALCVVVVVGGAADLPLAVIGVVLLWLLPTTLNTIVLWTYLGRRDVVPAS